MEITKYTSYFHDGNLIDIFHQGSNIVFILESRQIDENDVVNEIFLSKNNTLKWKLHIDKVKSISIGNKKCVNIIKKCDEGEILELEIHENKVLLLIEWKHFPPTSGITDVSKIEIQAEKIWWENMPDLI